MNDEQKLIWAAGFFDGEGFVTVGARGAYKGHKSLYLRVGVNHVAPEPLHVLHELFNGSLQPQKEGSVVGNRVARTRWVLNCASAASALERLLPFFFYYKDVAKLGLELQDTMCYRGGSTPDEVRERREEIRQEIIRLNSID